METAGRFLPRISLMVWENTHNLSGGRVVPLDVMDAGNAAARRHGLSVHVDGARVFNAAVALGVDADRIAEGSDTIQFCFSKGLGAPIGSVLCGDAEAMAEARYLRKRLGGGMRQVGVIAAPARIALRDRARVAEDHDLARALASRIAERAPEAVDPADVETNIVRVAVDHLPAPWPEIAERARADGVRVLGPMGGMWRLVTHRDVDIADVDRLVRAIFG